jgi:hypothetical protein
MKDEKEGVPSDPAAARLIINTSQHMLKFNEKTGRAAVPSHLNDPANLAIANAEANIQFSNRASSPDQPNVLTAAAQTGIGNNIALSSATGDTGTDNWQKVPLAASDRAEWAGAGAHEPGSGISVRVEEHLPNEPSRAAFDHSETAVVDHVVAPPFEMPPLATGKAGDRAVTAAGALMAPAHGVGDGADDITVTATRLAPAAADAPPAPGGAGHRMLAPSTSIGEAPHLRVAAEPPGEANIVHAPPPSPMLPLPADPMLPTGDAAYSADSLPPQALPAAAVATSGTGVASGSTKISLSAATLERLHAEEHLTVALNKQIDALAVRVAHNRK